MSNAEETKGSTERSYETMSGWIPLVLHLTVLIGMPILLVILFRDGFVPLALVAAVPIKIAWFIALGGYFTLQPNESRVLILFGEYKGTERRSGFHWTNPFFTKKKISLRAHNLNGPQLKVNDKRGNPIEIAAVVVRRVEDTAQACFDVQDYTDYVKVQSESAVRHLARSYCYDHGEDHEEDEVTLRGGGEEVMEALKVELQERLAKAGVRVEEARITHLAYAQEDRSVPIVRAADFLPMAKPQSLWLWA
jgi:regulator of protease activity HflC (stomatin/prohibitin superfamily)